MKRTLWLVLFIFIVGISLGGCACFPGLNCGKTVEEAPPPPPAVVKPAPAYVPPAPIPVPPPKKDRN